MPKLIPIETVKAAAAFIATLERSSGEEMRAAICRRFQDLSSTEFCLAVYAATEHHDLDQHADVLDAAQHIVFAKIELKPGLTEEEITEAVKRTAAKLMLAQLEIVGAIYQDGSADDGAQLVAQRHPDFSQGAIELIKRIAVDAAARGVDGVVVVDQRLKTITKPRQTSRPG